MNKLHTYFFIWFSIIFIGCQNQLPDPDTDAIFKSISKIYELNDDGSVNYQYTHELKYLTHMAFNRFYGESFVVYNPKKQKLQINKSITTQKDGTQVPSPENAYNEVLPRFAAGAPAFNHLREMVITHAGLEPDCIVNFDYELKSAKAYRPFLEENLLLAERSPIQKMNIVIKVPEGKTLNYQLLNSSVQPKISTKKGITTYKFIFEQLEALSFESNQPHYNEELPRLIFSTVTMQEAWASILAENSLSKNIIDKIDTKLKDSESDFDRVFALQDIVANNVNGFHIPLEHAGYQIRNFDAIWKSNGATELEKTLFLSALLNHYTIESKPIMAYPKSTYHENMGLLKNFGHSYVWVSIDDGPIIISAQSNKKKYNLAYELTDDLLQDMEGKLIEIKNETLTEPNKLFIKGELKLDTQGNLTGNTDLYMKGSIHPYFELLMDENCAKKIAGTALTGISPTKANLAKWNATESNITFDFEKKEAAKKQVNYNFLSIPRSGLGFDASHLGTINKNRNTPIEFVRPIEEVYDFNLQVPNGYILIQGNVDTTLTNAVGEIQIKLNHGLSGIEIYKKIIVNEHVISPASYADFRKLYLLWNEKSYNEIVLKGNHK